MTKRITKPAPGVRKKFLSLVIGLAITAPAWAQGTPEASDTAKRAASKKPAASQGARQAEQTTAKAAPDRSKGGLTPVCIGDLAPAANLNIPEGKSALLDLQKMQIPAPAWLRAVGNPEMVQIEPMTSPTPRSMFFVFGKKVGSTNLMFQNQDGRCGIVEVSVGVDTASVEATLRQLMPGEKDIKVTAAADSLVLSGSVSDAMAAEKVVMIAKAFTTKSNATNPQSGGLFAGPGQGTQAMAGGAAMERVVNMLSVAAPQQVMLEVKVAEISKTLLDKLGAGFSGLTTRGDWIARLTSNFVTGAGAALEVAKGDDALAIDAEKKDGLVKILAEPTIMAISGQEGSFLAGGKIFIPVAQNSDGGFLRITLEEKEFGVGLRFTPTVLDGGRINLKVAPEVSELSRDGVGIRASGVGGTAVLPLITTRRAATTVQLFDGQSFAIGGLIKNNVVQNIKALPMLGEVPVLGALFRSSDFQTEKTELVFIVTPRLAKPLPANPPLPTDKFVPPSRSEFFLGGKMEGDPTQGATPSGFQLN